MKIVVTYSLQLAQWFGDIATAMTKAMQEIGYDTSLIPTTSLNDFHDSYFDLIFVVAPHGYHDNSNPNSDFIKNPNKIYACWDLEQTPFCSHINETTARRFQRTMAYFNKYDFFFTESQAKTDYFIEKGFSAHTLNFGYHSQYTKPIEIPEKEFDIFFVGIMFPRRASILQQLKNAGLSIFPSTSNFFHPIEKAKAIRSSRICLNIHHNDLPYFEKPRIISDILSNEGFCISETIAYPEGFVNGQHLIMSTYDDFVSTVLDWMKRPTEREQIAKNALDYLKTEHLASQFITDALKLIKRI